MTQFIVREDRSVIRMFGRDPLKMIQGLATNDIAGAPAGASVYTAFLTPKGKMVGDAQVVRLDNGEILIEADRGAAQSIVANLKKFVPPLFARFEVMSDKSVFELLSGEDVVPQIPHLAALSNPFRPDSISLVISSEEIENATSSALNKAAAPISDAVLEIKRIEAGEPKWGRELTEDVIPLEAGLRHVAISETKGCYTGQEVIIRILHRGHVNRHLRGVLTGVGAVPAAGSELQNADGKTVGQITSACYSPMHEQAIALAYVRREVAPPATLQLNGNTVHVSELPFAAAASGAER